MNICISYKDREIFLGEVEVRGSFIKCTKLPFKATNISIDDDSYKTNIIAYSDCNEVILFIAEIRNTTNTIMPIYSLVKLTIPKIQLGQIEYIVSDEPKSILTAFVSELEKYSKEVGFDYAKIFKLQDSQY